MWRNKKPKNITIIDISNHTPKRKQIILVEEPEEAEFPSWFKIIVLGSIIPSIISIFGYLCYHCSKILF
jgi:hypothetical protein